MWWTQLFKAAQISANPGLNLNSSFFNPFFQEHQIIKLWSKRIILIFPLKLSDLKSNFTLTLGYLNLSLNNWALDSPYKRSGCNSCSGSLNVHKQDTIHSQFQSSSPHTGVYKGASKLSERPDKMLMEGGGGVWGTVMVWYPLRGSENAHSNLMSWKPG